MSVESCSIHLNNLLAWGHAPLVVEEGGRAIAEAEFFIGPDISPLDTTLDVSVIYVHSAFQRRGAGTMLMEEMISRGRSSGCRYMTVSGGLGAPSFYARFGFENLLDLAVIDCEVPEKTSPCRCDPYVPADFEMQPKSCLWVGRYQNPRQKWIEMVNKMKKRRLSCESASLGLRQSAGVLRSMNSWDSLHLNGEMPPTQISIAGRRHSRLKQSWNCWCTLSLLDTSGHLCYVTQM